LTWRGIYNENFVGHKHIQGGLGGPKK